MPTYEYDCSSCGERFEIRASAAELPRAPLCSECGSPDVRRYYGSVAFVGSRRASSAPGELRAADPGALTRNVARRYASSTADGAVKEVARRAERGAGPAELHDFVREVKADRETKAGKGRRAR